MTPQISNVLLISPLDMFLSYGLRLVSSHLQKNGITTTMVFLPSSTEIWQLFYNQQYRGYKDAVLKQIARLAADVDLIGITMMTMDKHRVQQLVSSLETTHKPIILGGVHPTIDPEDALKMTGLINIGEGYDSLVEYCRNPHNNTINNIAKSVDGELIINNCRPAIENLDSLAFPDFGIDNHYVLLSNTIVPLSKHIQEKLLGTVYHQFATFGCPFSCTYCINNTLKRIGPGYNRYRCHSPDYIIDEIKYGLALSPRIQYVNFPDDGFLSMSEETIEEFARKYREQIGLPFSVMGIIPEFVTQRKIDMLVDAGLKRVRIGLQSANAEALNIYRRPAKPDRYREIHETFEKHRRLVFPYYDIIVDNPLVDNERELLDTIHTLLEFRGRYTLLLFSLRFYPNTELYSRAAPLNLPKRYYEDPYTDYDRTLLNYVLTIMRITNNRAIIRGLLYVYRKRGNIKIPGFVFSVNKHLFILRCGIQHVIKGDMSGIPYLVVRCIGCISRLVSPLGMLYRRWQRRSSVPRGASPAHTGIGP